MRMILQPVFKHSFLMGRVQRTIRRLLRVGQLFGVVPWNVELDERNVLGRGRFVGHAVRVANMLFSLGIILAVCIATGFHYSIFVSSDFFAIRTLNISEDITVNGIVMLSMIGCQCLRPFYAKFTTRIVSIGDELATGGGTIDFRRVETVVQRALFGALLYFGSILVFDFLNGTAWPYRFLYRTVLYTLPNVINVLALYQYVVLLWFVTYFYRTVNRRLTVVEKKVSTLEGTEPDGNRRKVRPISGSAIAYDHVHLIEALRRTHLKISNLTGEVNDRFGALIVLTMLSSFVVLSLQLFELYKVMTMVHWSYRECILLVYTVLWIGLHAAKVLLVLYPCHLVQRERDRTGPMLYSFHQSFTDNYLHDALVKFSSQLLHEKESHTACGLITLDMTLMSTMLGALTTYLVILIQFHSAFVSGEKTRQVMVLELLSNKQLFKNDFLRAAHKTLRTCQLFGTVPWCVDLFGAQRQQRKLGSWRLRCAQGLNALYSIGLAAVVMAATVLQHYENDWKIPFMTRMLYIGEYITGNGVVLLVLIGCHYQRRYYQRFAEKLLTISVGIASCGASVDFQRIETIFNRLLVGVALFFGTGLAVDFLYNNRSLWDFLRSSSVYILANIINVLGLVQYDYLLYFIFLCYSDVNRLLTSYAHHVPHDKRYARRRTVVVTPSGGTTTTTTLLYDYAHLVDLLRAIHLELNELLEVVNDCFGVLIVSTTTAAFVVLSLQFYAIYRATTVRTWDVADTLLLVYTVLWIVLNGAKVLLVLYPCHLVQRERDRTGPILYHFSPHDKDTALNNALMKFSNQLLHESGHQTACGLINLEMTLISTMVGALTTYLVILIQFDTALTQGQAGTNSSATVAGSPSS